MSSQHLALTSYDFVKGIIFFGFPLHPAGKPSLERAEHLSQILMPMLFIQGTKDELAQWSLLTRVIQSLPDAKLYVLDGADHSFKKGKENFIPVIAEEVDRWIKGGLILP
jgi:predicted alpha/beta-hydrolase family hydrolase